MAKKSKTKTAIDVLAHNSASWDRRAREADIWTRAVSRATIAAARRGKPAVILTPTKPVPMAWFGKLKGARVLALGGGGGQQAPILAAAGAHVTTLDASANQLAQDKFVAERERLTIRLEQGDFADLSRFAKNSFDSIVHPTSNLFAADIASVWRECFRVLKPGGRLMSGFLNPITFAIDEERRSARNLRIRHKLPYADITHRTKKQLALHMKRGRSLEWGHSLTDQIAGQIAAGFRIIGFYEDASPGDPLSAFVPDHIATLAERAG